MRTQLLKTSILLTSLIVLNTASASEASHRELAVPYQKGSVYDTYGFSPAIRAGGFIYVSGVIAALPKNADGDVVAPTNETLKIAYKEAFDAIDKILKQASSNWNDVVDITTYHTDLSTQGAAITEVKSRYISEPYPAWTAIDIDRLFSDNGITEIKIVAYSPKN